MQRDSLALFALPLSIIFQYLLPRKLSYLRFKCGFPARHAKTKAPSAAHVSSMEEAEELEQEEEVESALE